MGDPVSGKGRQSTYPDDLATTRHERKMVRAAHRLQHGEIRHEPCGAGLAGELRPKGIAVNALWPRTIIATAAIKNLLGGEKRMRQARKPDIMADAAYAVLTSPSREFTGHFLIDDTFLAERGVSDFEHYRVDRTEPLAQDFFLPDDVAPPPGVQTIETYGDRQ
jgi:hypothetical protein